MQRNAQRNTRARAHVLAHAATCATRALYAVRFASEVGSVYDDVRLLSLLPPLTFTLARALGRSFSELLCWSSSGISLFAASFFFFRRATRPLAEAQGQRRGWTEARVLHGLSRRLEGEPHQHLPGPDAEGVVPTAPAAEVHGGLAVGATGGVEPREEAGRGVTRREAARHAALNIRPPHEDTRGRGSLGRLVGHGHGRGRGRSGG